MSDNNAAMALAVNSGMYFAIQQAQAANRLQATMAIINQKEEVIMDNKLLQNLKDEGTEITIVVLNDFGVKGRIVEFDDCFVKLESEQRNFKKKVQLLNRLFITKIIVKE